jgi:eukaryotic-like serine/threonine-protein kinase
VSLQVGDVIQNKYRIARLLGQGGMGAVFEGENLAIKRRVAIKVLHGALASQQAVVERFEREAQAAGRIGNDHILEVLDLGHLSDGDRYMVMEFLDGETLEQRIERLRRLDPSQIYPLARQLLIGLGAAHSAGIIHRDLKPDNVFIMREKAGTPDFVKIIDFGISKFTSLNTEFKMTATGAVMGTPYFMSPEQAKGSRDSDARSDLYAVGVILFKAVTGQVPFDASTFNELLFKIVLSETPRAGSLVPNLDPAFENIILKGMARDPGARFQNTREFITALDHWYAHGTGVAQSVGGQPFQGHLPTVALPQTTPGSPYSSPHSQGSNASFHRQTPAPGSRGWQPETQAALPPNSAGARASQPNLYGPQHTSGLNSPTGQFPNYPGVVTGGSWSNTGLRAEKSNRSVWWMLGGGTTLLLGAATFAYLFWNARREAPHEISESAAASTQVMAPTRAQVPAPLPPPPVAIPAPPPTPSVAPEPTAPARATPEVKAEANPRGTKRRVVAPEPPPRRAIEVSRPVPLPEPAAAPVPEPAPPPKPRRPVDSVDLGY